MARKSKSERESQIQSELRTKKENEDLKQLVRLLHNLFYDGCDCSWHKAEGMGCGPSPCYTYTDGRNRGCHLYSPEVGSADGCSPELEKLLMSVLAGGPDKSWLVDRTKKSKTWTP